MNTNCTQCNCNMSQYADYDYQFKNVNCPNCGKLHYVGIDEVLIDEEWEEFYYIDDYVLSDE